MSVAATQLQPIEAAEPGVKSKILLVDDTPENLISLEAALDSLGAELVSARSGTATSSGEAGAIAPTASYVSASQAGRRAQSIAIAEERPAPAIG